MAGVVVFSGNAASRAADGLSPPAQLNIPGERIYPESLTAAAGGRVFIGSIGTRQIFEVLPGAVTAHVWVGADADPGLGVFGVLADDRSQTLWACFSPVPGSGSAAHGPSALAAFNLRTGKLKARYLLPAAGAFCNDIAVAANGTAFVTDTSNMQIDALKAGDRQLHWWAGNGDFGPKGGILDGISVLGDRVLVNTLRTNKIFVVRVAGNGTAAKVEEIALSRAIEAPDGMRRFGKDSVLLVESGGAGRLSLLKIQGRTGTLTTLKSGFPGGPVAVAVVGTTGYVLEGQLASLYGPVGSASTVTLPFHASAVDVGRP